MLDGSITTEKRKTYFEVERAKGKVRNWQVEEENKGGLGQRDLPTQSKANANPHDGLAR